MVLNRFQVSAQDDTRTTTNVAIRVDDDGRLSCEVKLRYNTQFGGRLLTVAGQTAWNREPADIRQRQTTYAFRRHSNTYWFLKSYP